MACLFVLVGGNNFILAFCCQRFSPFDISLGLLGRQPPICLILAFMTIAMFITPLAALSGLKIKSVLVFAYGYSKIMPQLDIYSIANQLFWGSIFFALFYYLLVFVFVPTFFSSLYVRRVVSGGRSDELHELVGLIFATHLFVLFAFEIIERDLLKLVDQIIYSRAVSSDLYETYFEQEFASLFDDEANED